MTSYTHINPAPYNRKLSGEAVAASALEHALLAFDEPPVVLPNLILMTPEDDVGSAEGDFFVVTRAKVFIIEVKSHEARVYYTPGSNNIILCSQKGCNEIANPLGQNIRKVNYLKEKFPKIHFEAIAVMTSPFSIDQKVPANILHIDDLAYHMRRKSSDYRRSLKKFGSHPKGTHVDPLDNKSIEEVAKMLIAVSDQSTDAMQRHIERCQLNRTAKEVHADDQAQLAIKVLQESITRARRLGLTDSDIVDVISAIPDFSD